MRPSWLPGARALALAAVICAAVCCTVFSAEGKWKRPTVKLPEPLKHPVVACTPEELERLRAAYRSSGPEHDALAWIVRRAEAAVKRKLEFPPRGGQHNQWYQCERCQMGLKYVDDTHHRCPKCGKVYSGAPYDDVIFLKKHGRNLENARSCAWAHALTGEKKYADYTRAVLLGYAERYSKYPYHDNRCRTGKSASRSGGRLFEQTLNEASSMARTIGPAYDLVHDALSQGDRAAIRDGLFTPMLKNIDRHRAGKSNWQSWHNAAMLTGGAVIGEVDWVKRAISDKSNGFVKQMSISVSRDGMWYENSWGYHFYTLDALVLTAEGARRLGVDLWSHPKFKRMFTLPVRYTMANGRLPRFGDDVNSRATGRGRLMEPAHAAYGDEGILALLPAKPTWESVMLGRDVKKRGEAAGLESAVYSAAGHAILRTRGAAGLTAAVAFGPYGGFHGHFDKLSFVFFGHGRELGVDPGRARSQAYRLPVHKNWYKATSGHNAVVVDGRSQEGVEGKLEAFSAGADYAAVGASCDKAYEGVKHSRTLVMTPTYLLVVDRLSADKARRYDWIYHNRGSKAVCDAAATPGKLAKPFQGAEYIRNVRRGTADDPVRVRFVDKGLTTHLVMAEARGSGVAVGDGLLASVMDRVPVTVVTRKGEVALYACAIEPVLEGAEPGVASVRTEEKPGALVVTVERGGAADVLKLGPGGEISFEAAGEKVLPAP